MCSCCLVVRYAVDSEDVAGFRVSMGQLPPWAQKQVGAQPSSKPSSKNGGRSQSESLSKRPPPAEGRWAQVSLHTHNYEEVVVKNGAVSFFLSVSQSLSLHLKNRVC